MHSRMQRLPWLLLQECALIVAVWINRKHSLGGAEGEEDQLFEKSAGQPSWDDKQESVRDKVAVTVSVRIGQSALRHTSQRLRSSLGFEPGSPCSCLAFRTLESFHSEQGQPSTWTVSQVSISGRL